MIDLTREITLAQIAFALSVIALVLVSTEWSLYSGFNIKHTELIQ